MTGLRGRNKRQRRDVILTAAATLFTAQGYERTKMEEIAEAADVAPATVYNYFSTKQNILIALGIRHVRTAMPARRAFLRHLPADPVAGVQGFEKLLADQALRTLGRDCWRVILAAPFTQPGERLHRAGSFFNRLIMMHYVKMLRAYQDGGAIAAGADIPGLAELFMAIGTYNFSLRIARGGMPPVELNDAIERRVRLVFMGIAVTGKGLTPSAEG